MSKLMFKVSSNTQTLIKRYANSLGLSNQTVIRFLLVEQLNCYKNNAGQFEKEYRNCKPREACGTTTDYGEDKPPIEYRVKVNENIYNYVLSLEEKYNHERNTVINNLLHISLNKKLSNFDSEYATALQSLATQTKQYAIPLSNAFILRLQEISDITGIKINKLMSLMIGDYLIEHYTDYNSDLYIEPKTKKKYFGVW